MDTMMAGHVDAKEETGNEHRILLWRPVGQYSIGSPRSACEDITKI
jgi:hypothetical protein